MCFWQVDTTEVFLDRKEVIVEIPTNKRKSFVAEKPPRQGPSLERLLGVWKAAEREARRKKDAEVEAAQKVYYMHTHRLQALKQSYLNHFLS